MSTDALTVLHPDAMTVAGQAADQAATANVFLDYRDRRAAQTLRRQSADLALFARYLNEAYPGLGIRMAHFAEAIRNCPDRDELPSGTAWVGVSWGIVAGFVQWQLSKGYAVGSVNVRLATVKAYCQLANQAGAIGSEAYTQIKTVKGYGHKQAKKVDEKRETIRKGVKKPVAVSLTKEQADLLKYQPDTPQGRRDALLMCLLLDHGLRCGEVAGLQVTAFDLKAGTFTFHRPKVEKVQTHRMTADIIRAATAYLTQDAPALGPVLLGSRKGGRLQGGMSERAINDRVGALGRAIGVDGLSPHDCRHYWATRAARQGTDPFALQEAGGWNSLAMPRRYVEAAAIANEGVRL
jgi:integrase